MIQKMRRHNAGIGLLLVAAAAVGLLAVAYTFNPDGGAFPYPRCLFRQLTGWQCPGCGSARALHALLHGHPLRAFAFNPALPFLAALGIGALIVDRKGSPRLRRALFSAPAVAVLLVAVVLWTVCRNLLEV